MFSTLSKDNEYFTVAMFKYSLHKFRETTLFRKYQLI